MTPQLVKHVLPMRPSTHVENILNLSLVNVLLNVVQAREQSKNVSCTMLPMVIVKSASTPLKPTLTLKMLAQSLTTASARPRIKTICPLKNQISLATSVNVTRPFVVHTRTGLTGVTVAPLVTEVFNLEPDVLNSQMMLQINVKTKSKLATKMNVQNGLHGKHGLLAMVNVLMAIMYQRIGFTFNDYS